MWPFSRLYGSLAITKFKIYIYMIRGRYRMDLCTMYEEDSSGNVCAASMEHLIAILTLDWGEGCLCANV